MPLDTVGRRAVCIDLPQLEGIRNLYTLGLQTGRQGRELTVQRRRSAPGEPSPTRSSTLLTVSTTTFEVHEPRAARAKLSGDRELLFAAGTALGLIAVTLAWSAGRRRKAIERRSPEEA